MIAKQLFCTLIFIYRVAFIIIIKMSYIYILSVPHSVAHENKRKIIMLDWAFKKKNIQIYKSSTLNIKCIDFLIFL